MMMNAGESFWHEEKVTEDEVEMLQIFVRPSETNLPPKIQFHDKPTNNRNWYVMVGPEGSEAPLYVRQNVFILDAHPKAGEELEVPIYDGFIPFLYVMNGEITIQDFTIGKQEAVTDLVDPLPPLVANEDTTIVLFFVDMNAPMSMDGTISGSNKSRKNGLNLGIYFQILIRFLYSLKNEFIKHNFTHYSSGIEP